jgi:hypothetical protein
MKAMTAKKKTPKPMKSVKRWAIVDVKHGDIRYSAELFSHKHHANEMCDRSCERIARVEIREVTK